jgi:hypothetical protein
MSHLLETQEKMRQRKADLYVHTSTTYLILAFVDITNAGNNCERGGFLCEGYTQCTAFPRTTAPRQHPTQIQPKDSLQEHGSLLARYGGFQSRYLHGYHGVHLSAEYSFKPLSSPRRELGLTNLHLGLASNPRRRCLPTLCLKSSVADQRMWL